MIKSMTGFGRNEVSEEKRKITVEIKSVNHRYLDVNKKKKIFHGHLTFWKKHSILCIDQ